MGGGGGNTRSGQRIVTNCKGNQTQLDQPITRKRSTPRWRLWVGISKSSPSAASSPGEQPPVERARSKRISHQPPRPATKATAGTAQRQSLERQRAGDAVRPVRRDNGPVYPVSCPEKKRCGGGFGSNPRPCPPWAKPPGRRITVGRLAGRKYGAGVELPRGRVSHPSAQARGSPRRRWKWVRVVAPPTRICQRVASGGTPRPRYPPSRCRHPSKPPTGPSGSFSARKPITLDAPSRSIPRAVGLRPFRRLALETARYERARRADDIAGQMPHGRRFRRGRPWSRGPSPACGVNSPGACGVSRRPAGAARADAGSAFDGEEARQDPFHVAVHDRGVAKGDGGDGRRPW